MACMRAGRILAGTSSSEAKKSKFSRAESRGKNDRSLATAKPTCLRTVPALKQVSAPSISTRPESGRSMVEISLRVVVFPLPFGPSNTRTLPLCTRSETSTRARDSPLRSRLSQLNKAGRLQNARRGELDWERLARLADRHGVLPQVYSALAQAGEAPCAALSGLRPMYERSVHQALWLTRELLRIIECFESHSIRALAHKGPALAQILYGNVTSRQFADLDILVSPDDLPKVRACLAELGYEASLKLSPREERAYIAAGYELAFDLGEHRDLFGLALRILPPF